MTVVFFTIAGVLFLFFLYLQHVADVRAANYARRQQALAEERKNTLSAVLSSAHHQMSRQLVALAFDLDDLQESGVDTSRAQDSVNRLSESRDSIAVLAQLGQDEKWLKPTPVTAKQISPDTKSIRISLQTTTPIVADLPLLRVAITSITRHLEGHGFTDLRIEVDDDALRLAASRPVSSPQTSREEIGIDDLAERVLLAHDAEFNVTEEPLAWTLRARFANETTQAIDLRRSAGAQPSKTDTSARRVRV